MKMFTTIGIGIFSCAYRKIFVLSVFPLQEHCMLLLPVEITYQMDYLYGTILRSIIRKAWFR